MDDADGDGVRMLEFVGEGFEDAAVSPVAVDNEQLAGTGGTYVLADEGVEQAAERGSVQGNGASRPGVLKRQAVGQSG